MRPTVVLTSTGESPYRQCAPLTRNHSCGSSLYIMWGACCCNRHKSPEMWLSGQSVTAVSAVKESGSTPQSLQDSKEIIDMVGTQNEKIKAI